MTQRVTLEVPLNRVEGDLELRVELDGSVVVDAWSSGTMYRGFENIMVGRAALDGLVITPRICGICTTSHLTAAVGALESIAGITPPPDATRLREIALMTEHIQSDVRHGILMFAADFVNPAYANLELFDEVSRRYEPFRGETALEVLRETKKVLEIIAIIGGQWPHSCYMVPGGVVSIPSPPDLLQCRMILRHYREWYERRILGCSVDRWMAVHNGEEIDAWLDEAESHRNSDLGVFIRFARDLGLHTMGFGPSAFLSFTAQAHDDADGARGGFAFLRAASSGAGGRSVQHATFDQRQIAEHVAHSWFVDYEGGRHPFEGITQPYATGREGKKYSWAKAPRYDGNAAETGPLADAVISGDPLITDIVMRDGPSVFTRELARLARPSRMIPRIETLLGEISADRAFYESPGEITSGEGFGLTGATRGALGHWVRVSGGKIAHYQIITPTAWNASPRDSEGRRGPMEESLIGLVVKDPENPVELGHVVRSFDACLVCTVHTLRRGGRSFLTTRRV